MLTSEELTRYSRQMLIPWLGAEAQERLKSSHVLVAGIGGLGCSSSLFLTSAGVGSITLVDFDTVGLSDLNRQVIYWHKDIGRKKVEVAAEGLSQLNPDVRIYPQDARISESNVYDLLGVAEIVVDGLDNLGARYILNSACIKKGIPYIYGSVLGLRGVMTVIIPGKTPCLRCIYPKERVQTGPLPVLGSAPAIIANLQVIEAIKILAKRGPSLAGRMVVFHGDTMKFITLELKKNEVCEVCGKEQE